MTKLAPEWVRTSDPVIRSQENATMLRKKMSWFFYIINICTYVFMLYYYKMLDPPRGGGGGGNPSKWRYMHRLRRKEPPFSTPMV